MVAPFDAQSAARRLVEMADRADQRPVVDRATFLPIGQYEDGGLTFAWPGFLKEAWDGAQRSYLDAGRVPVPDAPAGSTWSGPLDAFNAASIAPMAGVAGRMSGAIPHGALGSGGSDVIRRFGTASADEVRKAYQDYAAVPSGWYVHGRSSAGGRYSIDQLRDDAPIQATRDFTIMDSYGQRESPGEGSGWAIRPTNNAVTLDLSHINTPDARRVGALALRDYRRGMFPDEPDGLSPRQLSERFRGHFSPDDIVSSAGGYDDTGLFNWLVETLDPRPQFVITPDGAVGLDREAVEAVRLFANPDTAALPAIFGHVEQRDGSRPSLDRALRLHDQYMMGR